MKTYFYVKIDGEFKKSSLDPWKSMQRSVSGCFLVIFFLQKRLIQPKSQEDAEYAREDQLLCKIGWRIQKK